MDRFQALDEYLWQVNDDSESTSPDEAFDWIHMLSENDWAALLAAWPVRPAGWREECAYVVGEGPPNKGVAFLEMAIFDLEFDVAFEAALGYSGLALDPNNNISPQPRITERIGLLRDLSSRSFEELERFVSRYRVGGPGA